MTILKKWEIAISYQNGRNSYSLDYVITQKNKNKNNIKIIKKKSKNHS